MVVKLEYREARTGDQYVIRYARHSDGIFRVFCPRHPKNPFDTSVLKCHLYSNGEVCIDHSKFAPRTLDQAKACAYLWMESYSQYVRSGVFPATGGRVNV